MATLDSTVLRSALIDYRSKLIKLYLEWPDIFESTHPRLIADIDAALFEIEGNVTTISLAPYTCSTF
jgi:hypothetical protein